MPLFQVDSIYAPAGTVHARTGRQNRADVPLAVRYLHGRVLFVFPITGKSNAPTPVYVHEKKGNAIQDDLHAQRASSGHHYPAEG